MAGLRRSGYVLRLQGPSATTSPCLFEDHTAKTQRVLLSPEKPVCYGVLLSEVMAEDAPRTDLFPGCLHSPSNDIHARRGSPSVHVRPASTRHGHRPVLTWEGLAGHANIRQIPLAVHEGPQHSRQGSAVIPRMGTVTPESVRCRGEAPVWSSSRASPTCSGRVPCTDPDLSRSISSVN